MTKHIFILLAVFFSSNILQAQELDVMDAINKVGHQRMLTQKMLCAYIKIGSGIKIADGKQDMETSAAEFEESMLELLDYSSDAEVVEAIEQLQDSWRIYSLKILSYPNKIMGSVLLNSSNKLLEEYDRLLILLEKQTANEGVRLVNLSGRQVMLAHKLEVLYLAEGWGLPNKLVNKALKNTNGEFEETQGLLLDVKMNKPQMIARLKETLETWRFLKSKFGNVPSPLAILDMTKAMQENMTETTAMYTELTKQIKVEVE